MESQPELAVHWDMSNVYPGLESPEFSQAVHTLSERLDGLKSYAEHHSISREGEVPEDTECLGGIIDGYLDRANDIRSLFRTLTAYLYSYTTTDSYNTLAKRLLSELQLQGSALWKIEVRFQGWIGSVSSKPSILEDVIIRGGSSREHAFYLREVSDQSQYLMTEAEEALVTDLSLSGSKGWEKLHGVMTSQLKGHFESDGQIEELPITVIQTKYNHSDSSIRRQAYDVELAAWESVREPLAACLNGVKGEINTVDKRRGRADALDGSLEKARIDRDTLEAMLAAMRGSFPAFRRYWKSKAGKLGLEQLPWWDLFAPVGKSERHFTFAEAAEFIGEQFGTFSDHLVYLTRRAFDGLWIDAEPRAGKVGGAFCMSIPAIEESRILCNFDGSLDQVATIAHELGHAYHNYCLEGKTQLQRRIPMTLAETASIFNQTIITDAMLVKSSSDDEKLGILESFLMNSGQVIVDIYSRYLFETEVFKRREKAELSADEFCELMLQCQRETFGDGLDGRYLHPYMWAWKPHYYSPGLSFYNFPYAFGLLFGLGLYQIYKQGAPGFQEDYDRLLRDAGEYPAAELAARFGIDIGRQEFWEDSLKLIEKRIDQYESIRPAND
jgi:pepF/M3 family oligoendopeptidase